MTSVFATDGTMYPVSVVEVLPNVVIQKKTVENDGYEALQVALEEKKENRANKCEKGIFAKANTTPKQFVREFRVENVADYVAGESVIKADIFAEGDKIDVTAKSKGKGYAGAIKRHGLHTGPKTHGSKYHRHAGSNGCATDPGKVFKGKKMAGHMGAVRVTVQNLEIVKIDAENDVILVKGSVPGPKKSLVMIKETVKSGK